MNNKRKRFSREQIIRLLEKADAPLANGSDVASAVRELGVSETTYYRRHTKYAGMNTKDTKRLKDLAKQNAILKPPLADAELGKAVLKESAEENF